MTETAPPPPIRPGMPWHYTALYAAGSLAGAGSLILLSLAFTIPEVRGLMGVAVALACLSCVDVAATTVHRKADRIERDQAALAWDLSRGLSYAEQGVAMMRSLTSVVDRLVTDGIADQEARSQVRELAAQQETLAELVADEGGRWTLDVATGDVYELGRRVGREEALRERGKDQTP